MHIDKNNPELNWISLILRLLMVSMFGIAVYGKLAMGFNNYAVSMVDMFNGSFLPGWLLRPYVYVLPVIELAIAVSLLIGFKLRETWIVTGITLVTLGFGMLVAKQGAVASSNYVYAVIACLGLFVSKYDGCVIGGCSCKKS